MSTPIPHLMAGLFLALPVAGATPAFHTVQVDDQIAIGYGVALADVDGDGKTDLVLADKERFVWYENPSWKKHLLTGKLTERDHVCVDARDVNGDGKADIAVGAQWNPGDTLNSGSVHYLIPAGDRSQPWQPVDLPKEPTVHRMRWVKRGDGSFILVMAPLHGRGNKGGKGDGVHILAYEIPKEPRAPWGTSVIEGHLHQTHNFDPLNWDQDPAEEILLAGVEGVFLLDPIANGWERTQLVGTEVGHGDFIGAGEVRGGRLEKGGRLLATVEPMHGNQAVVYREKKDGGWDRQVLVDDLADGHALACGDLLGTGGDQVVVGWRGNRRYPKNIGVRLYAPAEAGGRQWVAHEVDPDGMACEDLKLADLDGDGRLDIVACGRATKNLRIYFNRTARAR